MTLFLSSNSLARSTTSLGNTPTVCALASALLLTTASAPAQSAPDPWARVQQIAPNTHLKVSATHHGGDCLLQSVTPDSLVCAHGTSTRTLPRADIQQIKLARRGHSALLGLAVGAGIGAGAGAGIGAGINSTNQGSLLHVSGGKATAVGAAIGVILGGVTGTAIGYTTDLFASPTLYNP